MTRRAKWQKVKTEAGWHVRLVGANGEIVFSSEVYTREETADDALALAEQSFQEGEDAS